MVATKVNSKHTSRKGLVEMLRSREICIILDTLLIKFVTVVAFIFLTFTGMPGDSIVVALLVACDVFQRH